MTAGMPIADRATGAITSPAIARIDSRRPMADRVLTRPRYHSKMLRNIRRIPALNRNKKPDRRAGFFNSSATHSAKEAGRIDHARGRKQPERDQSQLHDPPPRKSKHTPGMSQFIGRPASVFAPCDLR